MISAGIRAHAIEIPLRDAENKEIRVALISGWPIAIVDCAGQWHDLSEFIQMGYRYPVESPFNAWPISANVLNCLLAGSKEAARSVRWAFLRNCYKWTGTSRSGGTWKREKGIIKDVVSGC